MYAVFCRLCCFCDMSLHTVGLANIHTFFVFQNSDIQAWMQRWRQACKRRVEQFIVANHQYASLSVRRKLKNGQKHSRTMETQFQMMHMFKQYICNYVKMSLQLLLLPKIPAVTLFIFFTVYWIFLLVSKPLMDPSWGREQRARESTRFKAGWFGSGISEDGGAEGGREHVPNLLVPSLPLWIFDAAD